MKDKLGRKIQPGDCVAYATKSGYAPELVIGEVLTVAPKKVTLRRVSTKHKTFHRRTTPARAISHRWPARILVITSLFQEEA